MEDKSLEYAKVHKREFLNSILKNKELNQNKDAVFMAGSLGAGKTEVAEALTAVMSNLVVIDADYFRSQFPDYNGKNSSLFQRGAAYLVDFCFTEVLKKSYSFILDGPFAIGKAKKNVERSINRDYQVSIYYVYQDPLIAWDFTKERERKQGRHVPKETFINAYFQSRKNISELKNQLGNQISLHIVQKDYQNNISDIQFDVDSLDLILPQMYSREELEEKIHD
ncbi:PezT Zeta toxin [Streptococcus varani]|uniref:UDP-N-acetylglucosamine kinase n=1 Tax=Streptococcus varani TaxID=1608583 RepID=A0A0E4CTU1_9STRE|nr:zeta toxin family protein [Streptococcus varani]CQR26094.1 PezT Zeta toxin [Streptococcus varani]